jgi:hypothetical protein
MALGCGRLAGRVPAETADHPLGGSLLNRASAIKERPAFSMQTKRTVRSVTTTPALPLTSA